MLNNRSQIQWMKLLVQHLVMEWYLRFCLKMRDGRDDSEAIVEANNTAADVMAKLHDWIHTKKDKSSWYREADQLKLQAKALDQTTEKRHMHAGIVDVEAMSCYHMGNLEAG